MDYHGIQCGVGKPQVGLTRNRRQTPPGPHNPSIQSPFLIPLTSANLHLHVIQGTMRNLTVQCTNSLSSGYLKSMFIQSLFTHSLLTHSLFAQSLINPPMPQSQTSRRFQVRLLCRCWDKLCGTSDPKPVSRQLSLARTLHVEPRQI
jgi:hypothetical protein